MNEIDKLKAVSFRDGNGNEVVHLRDAVSIVVNFLKKEGVLREEMGTVRERSDGRKWVEADNRDCFEEEVQKMEVGERVSVVIRKIV